MSDCRLFVPGRVCLFGEHSDWAGGYRRVNARIVPGRALVAGTNQGLRARARAHSSRLRFRTIFDGREQVCDLPMEPEALSAEAAGGGLFSYVAGVAWQALTAYRVRGLEIDNYETDLPVKRGLSSSAAVCVLTARAFNRIYDLKLTVRGEMELAYQGEIATPSRCGRMDQACAFGNRAVLMTFDGDRVDAREVTAARPLYFLVADLRGGKNTVEILSRLNKCYPIPDNPEQTRVHRYLGADNARLLDEAVAAFGAGDARAIGALMTRAQAGFDEALAPICPGELTAPKLHRALSHPAVSEYAWGGKGVGSGGDGTAQFICRDEASREALAGALHRDLGLDCHALTLGPAARVRKAVIPAAGLGTRLFPATKAMKKEFFPVIDRDGSPKPAIALTVAEALSGGAGEVALVVRPGDRAAFEALFHEPVAAAVWEALAPGERWRAEEFAALGRHVTLIEQPRPDGFGHAVWCAGSWIGGEPFLLLLPDHLYRSEGPGSCARGLVDAYDRLGRPLVGLVPEPESEIGAFGCVGGTWREEGVLLEIGEFAEKPDLAHARARLAVSAIPEGYYLTLSGQYVLTPAVFDLLAARIAQGTRERGEFPLTPCLDELRRAEGFYGRMMEGQRFDIGRPEGYRRALHEY